MMSIGWRNWERRSWPIPSRSWSTARKSVGFTKGMRSFTTTPYIFTSLRRGERCGWLMADGGSKLISFLIKVKPGADVESGRRAISASVPDIDVHTRDEFSWRTRKYWLIETGGAGLVLGIVISFGIRAAAAAAGTAVEIPPALLVCVAVLTTLLCSGAALLSIVRLRRLAPGMVFRT